MTLDKIDWSKLKPYAKDSRRSFEELCYQLVLLEYGAAARVVRVDGSGGDGGVEFYLPLDSGDELGWQAKFFWPDGRLTPSRKKQIKKSLQRACIEHPRLVRWTLMTPGNLTTAEQTWFKKELRAEMHERKPVVPRGRALELVHVPESELLARLGSPKSHGLREYFFGEVELTLDWFQGVADEATQLLHKKFLPTLHAATSVDEELERILAGEALATSLQERVKELAECNSRLRSARSAFDRVVGVDADAAAKLAAARLASDASIASFQAAHDKAAAAVGDLQAKRWRAARNSRSVATPGGEAAFRAAWDTIDGLSAKDVDLSALSSHEPRDWDHISFSVQRWTRKGWTEVIGVDHYLECLSHSEAHILGAAGQGKTHVSAHQVIGRLANGRPAILLLGFRFTSDETIETQILKLLRLEHVGWDAFLGAVAACADAYGTRIPIVIDGLNEALKGGGLSPIWKNHLAAACAGIKKRTDSVVLVTTCRGSYERTIWNGTAPAARLELDAATNYDVREAVERYFKEYKIVADPTSAPLEHFQHPIYLRLFCEAHNPAKEVPREVSLGAETLFNVFDKYLSECDIRAREKLRRLAGVPLVVPALEKLGGLLWTETRRSCPMAKAASAIDGKPFAKIDADSSLTKFLEQEDVLIMRDWEGTGERARFAYDLMGGYCIARYLIARQTAKPSTFSEQSFVTRLFGEEFSERHPLAEDIVRSLAVLCPALLGQRLDKLVARDQAFSAAVEALFEGNPAKVGADDRMMVAKLFTAPKNRPWLVHLLDSVATNPAHPLNAAFLSQLLAPLPMCERDSSWTEHLRENTEGCRRRLRTLEGASRAYVQRAPTLVATPLLQLMAQYAQWVLTSTVRPLRDEATRALYWFGRAFPIELLELTKAALSFNDLYVAERLLAAQYGVMMARAWERGAGSYEDALAPVARTVFDLVFARGSPFPLAHCLARDFAQNTVRRALVEQPSLLTTAQRELVEHPFPSIPRPDWPVVEDPNEGKYRDGNSPFGMDFANYTLGRLVPDRSNYDFQNPEYKRVRGQIVGRMLGLGYSLERFGEVDREIASAGYYSGRTDNPDRVDRYGKKYAWIAFYELAGIRSAKGLLKASYGDRPRMSDIDIEPSFPSELRGKRPPFIPDMLLPPVEPLHVWLRDGGVPDLEPLLARTDVIGDAESILVDAFLCEKNGPCNAKAWLQSYIVSRSDAERIIKAAAEGRLGDSLSHVTGDHYTFAGEYPWLPELEPNGLDEIRIPLPPVKRERVQTTTKWFRDGKEINLGAIRALLVSDDVNMFKGTKRSWLAYAAEQRQKLKITFKAIKETVVEDCHDIEEIKALRTVRDYSWEGYHTTTAVGRNFSTLAPEIARALSLHVRPEDWELFHRDGTQVTRNIVFGESWGTEGALVYARRSALERCLTDEENALIVIAAGERIVDGDHLDLADEAYKLSDGRGTWDRAWIMLGSGNKGRGKPKAPARAGRRVRKSLDPSTTKTALRTPKRRRG